MHTDGKPNRVWIDLSRQRKWDNLDYTIVMLAFSLPLSTSATGILAGIWFVGAAITFRPNELRDAMTNPAGGLPVLLVLLAAVGMLWADASWSERATGLRPFFKLLAIPLLLVQFRHSNRGWWPVYGLLAGCVVLMAASFAETLLARSLPGKLPGIVVKDYISQSGFFVICIFLLLEFAERAWRERKTGLLFGQVALIVAFLIDISYVATSRTSLVVMPVLLLLFGLRRSWKIAIGASAVWAVLFIGAWASSPYLQHRLESAFSIRHDDPQLDAVSNRQRLAYWDASIELIEQAPLIGHGTGSIPRLFRDYLAASPQSGLDGIANPHNQTLIIALQLGAMGIIVLYAMWFAHAGMFFQRSLAAWFGLIIVTQNIVSSLINSHLTDFTQGWTYAVCVGVAGGMIQRNDKPATDR